MVVSAKDTGSSRVGVECFFYHVFGGVEVVGQLSLPYISVGRLSEVVEYCADDVHEMVGCVASALQADATGGWL